MRNAEAKVISIRKSFVATQIHYQQLKSEFECFGGQLAKDGYDFAASAKDIGIIVQKIDMVATNSIAVRKEKKRIENIFGNRENVIQFVLQRMNDWKLSVEYEDGHTIEKFLSVARQKVDLLKNSRDALVNAPENVSSLQKSLDHHLADKGYLEKEVSIATQYVLIINRLSLITIRYDIFTL